MTMDDLITFLKTKAKTGKVMGYEDEDFIPADYGNSDDVYDMGVDEGEVALARELLIKLDA